MEHPKSPSLTTTCINGEIHRWRICFRVWDRGEWCIPYACIL